MSFAVDIEIRTTSPNRLHSDHYWMRRNRVRRERKATWAVLANLNLPRLLPPIGAPPLVVCFVRCGPNLIDTDSLPFMLKAVRDQVAEMLGLPNDGPRERRVRWRYAQCLVRERCTYRTPGLYGKTKQGFRIWVQVAFITGAAS